VKISTLENMVQQLNKRTEILEEEKKEYLGRIERLESEMNQVWDILAATGQATIEDVENGHAESHGNRIVDDDDAATEAASDASQGQLTQQSSWTRWFAS
jgi:predicted Ser/Thr protein kinase